MTDRTADPNSFPPPGGGTDKGVDTEDATTAPRRAPGEAVRTLAFWRSPADQPRWARPVLLVIAGLAGLSYAWGMGNFPLESFYAAAVRSMGSNWKDFFFGAVDPAGTVSLDKLPGAFWVQALSVRVFGFHYWAVVLPQVVAGVLTVLVLYRAVRRLAGPGAGLVAALILAVSPVTALVNRGNVSDSLLILLTVLAADALIRSLGSGQRSALLMAGVWVGLAFQTKMLQAWLIVPALFVTYVVAAPETLRRRLVDVGLATLVILIVSLSWMSVVASVPGHDRPYVDGTTDNSIYAQVFVYNGWARLGIHADADTIVRNPEPFLAEIARSSPQVGRFRPGESPQRLLSGPLGRDDAWLLPAALFSIVGVLRRRRSTPRTDAIRSAVLLWGIWLITLAVFFSVGATVNSYYTAALIPAVAALCATGLACAWQARATSGMSRALLLALVPLTTLYAVLLIPSGAGVRAWIVPLAVGVCLVAEVGLAVSMGLGPGGVISPGLAIGVAALSAILVPAVTTGLVVNEDLGPFSTPYQPAATTRYLTAGPQNYQTHAGQIAASWAREHPGPGIVAAIDTSGLAAPQIMVTGREFLPIGGFSGGNPSPSLSQLKRLEGSGQVTVFVVPISPKGKDPRMVWVRTHCDLENSSPDAPGVTVGIYDCPRDEHVRASPATPSP